MSTVVYPSSVTAAWWSEFCEEAIRIASRCADKVANWIPRSDCRFLSRRGAKRWRRNETKAMEREIRKGEKQEKEYSGKCLG